MKDISKGKDEKSTPRTKENHRLGNHSWKADIDSNQGISLVTEVKETENICLDFKIALDQ